MAALIKSSSVSVMFTLCVFVVVCAQLYLGSLLSTAAPISATTPQSFITPREYLCGDHDNVVPNSVAGKKNLVHSAVILRHGDRSPVSNKFPMYSCWPNAAEWNCDENPVDYTVDKSNGERYYTKNYVSGRNMSPGNCFEGELTPKGFQQEFVHGEYLRAIYRDYLPGSYEPSLNFLRADDVPRVILSLEALVMGLYPANHTSSPSGPPKGLFSINLMDKTIDNTFPNARICPALNTLASKWTSSTTFKRFAKQTAEPLTASLSAILNTPRDLTEVGGCFDCFVTHSCQGKEFPAGVTQSLYEQIIDAGEYQYNGLMNSTFSQFPNVNWATLAMGGYIGDVLSEIESNVEGGAGRKISLFAGHDTTIMPILKAYDVFDGLWPSYAAWIRIETYTMSESESELYVNFYYNNKRMDLPQCQHPATWACFKSVSKDIVNSRSYCGGVEVSEN